MLRKSTDSDSDALIFDLEDSVAKSEKGRARENVFKCVRPLAPLTAIAPAHDDLSARAQRAAHCRPPVRTRRLA